MTTVTISMPESLKQFLDHEVETKGYGNVSEYVRGLLRQAQAKDADARLEALLLEGVTSGEDIRLTQDFWRELKAEARQILAKRKKTQKARGTRIAKWSTLFDPPRAKIFSVNIATTSLSKTPKRLRFLGAIQGAIRQVCKRPGIGAPKILNNPAFEGLRSWPVKSFPAIRIYYVTSEKMLRVIRVLHGKRDIDPLLEDDSSG
jgi:antitoxin ParD1/3/4